MNNPLNSTTYQKDIDKLIEANDFKKLANRTIMVIGATGLIGSAAIDVLVALNKKYNYGINIIAAGRNKKAVYDRFSQQIDFFEFDALSPVVPTRRIDYIVYAAGLASPELYINQPVETILSNIIGVNSILNYCRFFIDTKLVYLSSSEVYGKRMIAKPFEENDYGIINQDNIRNSYAVAKQSAEMLCRAYSREYSAKVSILRLGHVFGPSCSIGDKRVASDFAIKAAHGVNIDLLSEGLQKRSYCYSLDCVAAIFVVMLNGEHGAAYNLGTMEQMSILEMAGILAAAGKVHIEKKCASEKETATFNTMQDSSLSFEKIKRIGYHQVFSAKEGLEHTVLIMREI